MKHNISVTLLIIGLFLACHLVGLFLVDVSNPVIQTVNEKNETIVIHETKEVAGIGKMEPIENPYIPILIGVLIGTGIMLILIRFQRFFIMKSWHVLGIIMCLYVSFYTALSYFFSARIADTTIIIISLSVSVILSILRVKWPNVYVHNFSEIFIYSGIAVLFASLFKTPDLKSASVFYAAMLLIGISIYDAIAVWQSKHMITLAKSQTEQKVFAGLFIPYKRKDKLFDSEPKQDEQKIIYTKKSSMKKVIQKNSAKNDKDEKSAMKIFDTNYKTEEVKSAILGGGDIAFTLLFSAVVFLSTYSFLKASIVSLVTTLSLALLLFFAKKDTFYPAMPFLSAGCFIGYGLILLF